MEDHTIEPTTEIHTIDSLSARIEVLETELQDLGAQIKTAIDELTDKFVAPVEVATPTPEPVQSLPPFLSREYVELYSGERGEDISEPVFNNAVKIWSEKWATEPQHLSFEWIRKNCL